MYNRHSKLKPVQAFQLFCLENYRCEKGISGIQALNEFTNARAFHYLASGYEVLHTQSRKYILSELDQFLSQQNGALPRK